ncbi:MAG: hypothetical protein ACJATI_002520 [Halioglobus sp.]|jgi:hypothetical protein
MNIEVIDHCSDVYEFQNGLNLDWDLQATIANAVLLFLLKRFILTNLGL